MSFSLVSSALPVPQSPFPCPAWVALSELSDDSLPSPLPPSLSQLLLSADVTDFQAPSPGPFYCCSSDQPLLTEAGSAPLCLGSALPPQAGKGRRIPVVLMVSQVLLHQLALSTVHL